MTFQARPRPSGEVRFLVRDTKVERLGRAVPKGLVPVAAYVSTAPSANTSEAGVTGLPTNCSGP